MTLEEKEEILTRALSTEPGLTKFKEIIRMSLVGEWRPSTGGLKCYKCGSNNIETQIGFMEHWSGLRKHCFDCDYRSHGLEIKPRDLLKAERVEYIKIEGVVE